ENEIDAIPAISSLQHGLSFRWPVEQSTLLTNHYVTHVCRITSSFDSSKNPFRADVLEMMKKSRLLFLSVMSISSAHFYRAEPGSTVPLSFQTEAVCEISRHLVALKQTSPGEAGTSSEQLCPKPTGSIHPVATDVLIGIILLGMTSSWHDPSALGLCHIQGCRQLFQWWVRSKGLGSLEGLQSMRENHVFLVSSMVYWESMIAFLIDQDTDILSYLDPLCSSVLIPPTQVCPWTGVATSIFFLLAKAGIIIRKRRALRHSHLPNENENEVSVAPDHMQLFTEACSVENATLDVRIPFPTSIADTGDLQTPPSHFSQLARCYQMGIRLELYRAFPELAESRMQLEPAAVMMVPCDGIDRVSQLVLGLAFEILDILGTIPHDSGTIATQTLIFLIAGAALRQSKPGAGGLLTSEQNMLNHAVLRRRRFILQRLNRTYHIVGLRTIERVCTLLVHVWSGMDSGTESQQHVSSCNEDLMSKTHWIDVMEELRLHTIPG
ncbi:hypothetical protein GCG54_00008402, partial [Colletotrichum gloeosporioides]